jgi:hypothetical protein
MNLMFSRNDSRQKISLKALDSLTRVKKSRAEADNTTTAPGNIFPNTLFNALNPARCCRFAQAEIPVNGGATYRSLLRGAP